MTSTEVNMPLGGDGYHKGNRATATCYCGAVQLEFVSRRSFPDAKPTSIPPWSTVSGASSNQLMDINQPTEGDDLVDSFICNCYDCRKITASMFASNFIAKDSGVKHNRGEELLTKFSQNNTIQTGNTMSNYFCSKCGTLMYRVSTGFPGTKVMRIGTIDDFNLQETKLKPRIEQFTKDRVSWCKGGEGVIQDPGNFFDSRKPEFQ